MLAIWGISPATLQAYQLFDSEDRKRVCFVAGGRKNQEKYKGQLLILDKAQLRDYPIDKLWIPASEMRIENTILWEVYRSTELRAAQIWTMDVEAFSRQIKKYGSLEHLLRSDEIPYICALEYDVVSHCNLNCKGCSHFSPLSGPEEGDPENFQKDLRRIRGMVNEIGEIRLLGGEPLLSDHLPQYIEAAREIYPDSEIIVFTNGIRLGGIDESLKDCMKKQNARFQISLYPPVMQYVQRVKKELEREGICCKIGYDAVAFGAWLNPSGDSDPEAAAASCIIPFCHALRNGRLFKCSTEARIDVFENYFQTGAGFPEGGIDLYDPSLTPEKLYTYLMSPVGMCRFCGRLRPFFWDRAGKHPSAEDWYGQGKV